MGVNYDLRFRHEDIQEHTLYEQNIPRKIKLFVLERDQWCCRSCNSNNQIAPHHIYPRAQGRDHHPDNIIILCFDCHRAIHDGELILRVVEGNYFFGGKKRWRNR